MKKIFAFTLALIMLLSSVVSAEYNKYNEEPYVNMYNLTVGEVAELLGVTLEEFKEFYGLPEDMPADTNETAAYYNLTLENYASMQDLQVDELINQLKEMTGMEVDANTLYKDAESLLTVKDLLGGDTIEEFREYYGVGEEITEDTLFSKVNNIVCRQILSSSGNLKYFTPDAILVMLKGKYLDFDVAPVIINDRTMVPLRAIFEALEAEVTWNADTKTVYAKRENIDISITIGSTELNKSVTNDEGVITDSVYTLDSPAVIIDDRTLVPLRAVAESFDIEVGYVPQTKTAVIH